MSNPPDLKARLAEELRSLVGDRHGAQAELARETGLRPGAISKMIQYGSGITIENVDAILRAIDVDWNTFMSMVHREERPGSDHREEVLIELLLRERDAHQDEREALKELERRLKALEDGIPKLIEEQWGRERQHQASIEDAAEMKREFFESKREEDRRRISNGGHDK